MKIVFAGPPGSGKGTVAKMVHDKYGWCHISVGEILRERAESDSKIKSLMASGALLSNAIIIQIVKSRLERPDCNGGYILDGFPRDLEQAEAMESFSSPELVLVLDCPDKLIVERISSRFECKKCGIPYGLNHLPKKKGVCDVCKGALSQRDDDKPETVKNRLVVYNKSTAPIIGFYEGKGIVRHVDGTGSPEAVFERVVKVIESFA